MTDGFARRIDELTPFLAMEVMERGFALARDGVDVVHLGVGEPDFDAPEPVVEAVVRAVRGGETHYTDSRGLYALRAAIAEDCRERRGVAVDPDQVLVTSGTSPAMLMVFALLLDPGDEVLVPTPHYPCYPNLIRAWGGRPVYVPTGPEDGWIVDPARVRAAVTPRTKALMLASPANPTGAVQPPDVVDALADLGVPVLSDEIYDGLLYDDAIVTSPLGLAERCFVFDGFSKRYAMTGFRLGYVIAPPDAMRALQTLQQNLFISTNHFVQRAGVAALRDGAPALEVMRAEYAARRDLLVAGLRNLGLGIDVMPPGAFYALADARHLGDDSLALAFELLRRAHVAVGPGRDFGELAEGFLRFSFCASRERIAEGLRRLEPAIAALADR